MSYLRFAEYVEPHREKILEVERYIWKHPETGFREWNTSKYLGKIFEDYGYDVKYAGDIPGFYTDIETEKPGPKVLVLGELDALLCPNHPEQIKGCAHACGHNTQCASLAGLALALKEPGALEGLSGSIRLCAVPAEELIEIEYRDSLRRAGTIRYLGGKTEFLYRGYFDGCTIAFMHHASIHPGKQQYDVNDSNGCIAKTVTYEGVASHAGGSPDKGINAMYAMTQGLNAINALRETFRDDEHVRVHPIVTNGGSSANIIPSKSVLQSYVRGASLESINKNNEKVNRALASGAIALGAEVLVEDRPGYAPLVNDRGLRHLMCEVAKELYGENNVVEELPWGCASTDMGDLSCIMRVVHAHVSGSIGHSHGDDYYIEDTESACIMSAKVYIMVLHALLENDAAKAKEILSGPAPKFASKEAYFDYMDKNFMADRRMVQYTESGAVVSWK